MSFIITLDIYTQPGQQAAEKSHRMIYESSETTGRNLFRQTHLKVNIYNFDIFEES